MAFNALQQPRQCRSSSSSLSVSCTRSMAKFAAAASSASVGGSGGGLRSKLPAYGPMWAVIGIMGGMVGVACCIGIHTAKQQLFHSPSVQITKKKRESVPEVDTPDDVAQSGLKFYNKSFLRKVARIQDNNHIDKPNHH